MQPGRAPSASVVCLSVCLLWPHLALCGVLHGSGHQCLLISGPTSSLWLFMEGQELSTDEEKPQRS